MAECIILIMKDLIQSLYLSKDLVQSLYLSKDLVQSLSLSKDLVQSLCWTDGEHLSSIKALFLYFRYFQKKYSFKFTCA